MVDRRLIVDEATRRAERIAEALRKALSDPHNPLHEVACALVKCGGEPQEPLLVAKLRGGMELDDSWARNPAQPTVILSTVDQAGSRLLFRAYGATGPRSWPISAGLLGIDSLYLVDEAHCSRPFCETVAAIVERWQNAADNPLTPPLVLVPLSATLPEPGEFQLDQADLQYPVLAQRLRTPKPARLQLVSKQSRKSSASEAPPERGELESCIVELTGTWLASSSSGVLAIVVNRVASARRIFERLDVPAERKLLLTGRARPWERDQLLESWLPRIRAGRDANDGTGPLVVVTTQCVEVGADLDFDYLITEAASLDALRQRFGRLDRLGLRCQRLQRASHTEPVGVIVAHEEQVGRDARGNVKTPDPVYGNSLAETWKFLSRIARKGVVDFSHDGLAVHLANADIGSLVQVQPQAYVLLPAHLDLLAHTSPPPEPDVEIAAFLHGTTSAAPEVTLVWRAGLSQQGLENWADVVAIQPPLAGEGCPVPIWEARAWLQRSGVNEDQSHDLEGLMAGDAGTGAAKDSGQSRPALAWRGPDDSVIRWPKEIRPGDVLIVPVEYGGCGPFGWNPADMKPVSDIGDAVAASLGRRPVLRLAGLQGLEPAPPGTDQEAPPSTLSAVLAEFQEASEQWPEDPDRQPEDVKQFLSGVASWALQNSLQWLKDSASRLRDDGRWKLISDEQGHPLAVVGSRSRGEDGQTGADTSTFRGIRRVRLADHLEGVARAVQHFADRLNLSPDLKEALRCAALRHDLGKRDPRFQAWLVGRPLASPTDLADPLAKSPDISPRHWAAVRRAREFAGYPLGNRHEALSAAFLLEDGQLIPSDLDRDLVIHLISSHHGFSRPWFPAVQDEEGKELLIECELEGCTVRVRAAHNMHDPARGTVRRFWRLLRRYGWWGLAYLEAVLRLADQHRSAEEEVSTNHDRAEADRSAR